MACPFNNGVAPRIKDNDDDDDDDDGDNPSVTYSEYLHLDDLLKCTVLHSKVHDEHLFIIIHQVYELWFKQILHEIDSVRDMFSLPRVDERSMLKVNTRLSRVAKILSILVDQVKILETMTPLDFAAFRSELGTSSGFQSWQFRLIENKIGVSNAQRIKYNQAKYSDILQGDYRVLVEKSESEPSLFDSVGSWLERTPGLNTENFDFWKEFIGTCHRWFTEGMKHAEETMDPIKREHLIESCKKDQENFKQIFVKENYEDLVARGERSLSWDAFKGALMIYYNKDEVLFHGPFQLLTLLMDIDVLLTKWRSAHVLLVQRQIGSKVGTGGSSGYLYLRSTLSDRYRPFLDLFQLSNYLIPCKYVKELQQCLAESKLKNDVSS